MGRDSATFSDKGTEVSSLSRDKGTTGQAQNLATGRNRPDQPVKIQEGTGRGTGRGMGRARFGQAIRQWMYFLHSIKNSLFILELNCLIGWLGTNSWRKFQAYNSLDKPDTLQGF